MNPLIVIPVFVTSSRSGETPIEATYDHPSTLGHIDELPRCLESLGKVEQMGPIAVIVAADPEIDAPATERVRAICDQFSQLDIIVVGSAEVALIRKRFEQLNLDRQEKEIGLVGYSAVRNLGLVLANVLGFDAVLFLDDDEVVDDVDFMSKAMYGLGKLTKRGIPILAKTGYYLNSEGTYHSLHQDKWYNRYWEQGRVFNKWIDTAMRGPRLSRSNHVCGGCMAIHREAFKRICFDPWVVRGEDLDYLLNLRMFGSDVWFDNQWKLHHLPPETRSEGRRFRQDIYRWLYEFRKIEYSRSQVDLQQIKPSSLEPYPGPFLEEGIEKRVKRTAWLRSFGRPDKAAYREAASAAANAAALYAQEHCANYFEFQSVWPEIMARTEGDKALSAALLHSVVPDDSAADQPVRNIDPGSTGEIRLNLDE
ncbi:MAG: hypothetical protein IJ113_08805 [Eggerthellaceae bacterium]|nr:hypothetical protein [Eggerthellaceae bacterium]